MRVVWWMVLIVIELMIVWLLYSWGHWGYAFCLVLAMAPSVYFAWPVVHWYGCILQQIRTFNTALPKPLPDTAIQPVPVEWWSLVKSGLSPQLTRPYTYPEIGLIGRPWRMFVRNSRFVRGFRLSSISVILVTRLRLRPAISFCWLLVLY